MTTQEKILQFIENYRAEHGCSPLQSVIAREFDMTRQNIRYHFDKMQEDLKKYPEYMRYFNKEKPTKEE